VEALREPPSLQYVRGVHALRGIECAGCGWLRCWLAELLSWSKRRPLVIEVLSFTQRQRGPGPWREALPLLRAKSKQGDKGRADASRVSGRAPGRGWGRRGPLASAPAPGRTAASRRGLRLITLPAPGAPSSHTTSLGVRKSCGRQGGRRSVGEGGGGVPRGGAATAAQNGRLPQP
jgi:hypothetical protein